LPGQRDRRRHHLTKGQPAVVVERRGQSHHRAGNRDRLVAAQAFPRDHVPLRVEIHARRGRQRRGFAEIQKFVRAVGEVDHHEAAAAQIAAARMHHRFGKADGHGGIDGISPVLQDVHADPGGETLSADHHAVCRGHRRRECGTHRRDCQRR
jgi:hypothetical protein